MRKIFIFLIIGMILASIVGGIILSNKPGQTEIQEKAIPLKVQGMEREVLLKVPEYTNADLDVSFNDRTTNEKIVEFDLKSHPSVNYIKQVGIGSQIVMWYDISSVYGLENALGEPRFIDMKTGENVEKDWKYVYFTEETYESPTYSCSNELNLNGTMSKVCSQNGTETKTREMWLPYNSKDIPKGNIRLGIEVNNKEGDYLDGVWNVGGLSIDKHSEWTASLNNGIVSYYNFNTGSGSTLVDNVLGVRNGTLSNSSGWVSGLLGSSVSFDGVDDIINITNATGLFGNNQVSYSYWIYPITNITTSQYHWDSIGAGRNYNLLATTVWQPALGGSTDIFPSPNINYSSYGNTWTLNAWHHVVVVADSSGANQFWFDGVNRRNSTTIWTPTNAGSTYLGNRYDFGTPLNARLDEMGFWNRTLSGAEVVQLYNLGTGITYNATAPSGLSNFGITLNNPVNNQLINTNSIIFSTTPVSGVNTNNLNVSIYGNWSGGWSLKTYNESAFNNTQTNFTLSNVPDGKYIWNALLNNGSNQTFATSNFTFTKDTIFPQIGNITSPVTGINYPYLFYGNNLTLNVTVTDISLDKCWYSYNNSNTTFSCTTGIVATANVPLTNQTTIRVYANDTFGNFNSTTTSWTYNLFDFNNYIYSSSISESSSTIIKGRFQLNSSLSTSKLQYNNTNYTVGATSLTDNIYVLSSTAMSPAINVNVNVSWFFWINGINATSFNQTIINSNIGNCTVYSNMIFNFSILNEESFESLENTTADYSFNIYNLQRTAIVMSTNMSETSNPFTVCLQNPLSSNYSIDATIRYHGQIPIYATRYYNFLNFTLANSTVPQTITLYDINTTNSLPFLLTFRDSTLALAPNILIKVNKQYLATNNFKTVEIPKTDTNGQTILNLIRNTAVYNLIMIDIGGNIIASFSNIVAFCQDYTIGSCSIDLSARSTGQTTYDYKDDVGISTSLTYTNSTSTIALAFNSLSSSAQTVRMEVLTPNQFENQSVCDSSATLLTGILTCDISGSLGTNQYFFVNVYSGGRLITTEYINANPSLATSGGFAGSDGYFIAFLLILLIICLFSDDKQTLAVALGLGWITVIALGIIRGAIIGATSGGIWLIITIIIIIWKLKQEETGT